MDTPESTYQATFDTLPGVWSDVYLPWHNFVPVRRAQSDPEGEPLNPSKVRGRQHCYCCCPPPWSGGLGVIPRGSR